MIIWEPLFRPVQMARSFSGRWSCFHTGPQVGKGLDHLGPGRLKCERTQRRELGERDRAGSWKEERERQRQRENETPVMQKRRCLKEQNP